MAKICFVDLETTGVMYWKNGIHQISGAIVMDGEVKEGFDFHVAPNPAAVVEEEALKVSGVTLEQVTSYPAMGQVHKEFVSMLDKYVNKYDKYDKMFLAGYNNLSFDNNFLRAWFRQNGNEFFGSYFWAGGIDVMSLALLYLMDRRKSMENFKLMTVAKEVGVQIDESKLHNASYDIYLTMEIYRIVTGGAKW